MIAKLNWKKDADAVAKLCAAFGKLGERGGEIVKEGVLIRSVSHKVWRETWVGVQRAVRAQPDQILFIRLLFPIKVGVVEFKPVSRPRSAARHTNVSLRAVTLGVHKRTSRKLCPILRPVPKLRRPTPLFKRPSNRVRARQRDDFSIV